jgi:hypothetical protein
VSQAVKRGAQADVGGGASAEIPDSVFQTLEELWKIISDYVFEDDYDAALQVAREAAARWGTDSDAAPVFAWVVATGADSGYIAHPQLISEGLAAATVAVSRQPSESRNWECKMSLLLAGRDAAGAVTVAADAERQLPLVTPRLLVLKARGLMGVSRAEDGMVAAVRAVQAAQADPDVLTAVRSQATSMLVEWAERNLLPISTPVALGKYVEMIDAAAWCSWGVPEAEDMVRVHRMWATNAGQRVFVGSWKLRSFFAVCTGFISLPIHNYVRSEPAWRVFRNGLQQESVSESFYIVAGPQYVQRAHNMKINIRLDDL